MTLGSNSSEKRKKSNAQKREAWVVIRLPLALRDRIKDLSVEDRAASGQKQTMHKTIARALDTLEDPKGAARIRALERELVSERAQTERLREMHRYASNALAKLRRENGINPFGVPVKH